MKHFFLISVIATKQTQIKKWLKNNILVEINYQLPCNIIIRKFIIESIDKVKYSKPILLRPYLYARARAPVIIVVTMTFYTAKIKSQIRRVGNI